MPTLYGTLLQPRSASDCRILPHAIVEIGDDGRIASVASAPSASPPAGDVMGDEGCWIVPGFVDAHLHLSQWDRRGIDGLSLSQWQEQIGYPAEARLRDPQIAERLAEEFVTGLIQNGTTTVAAFGSPYPEEVERSFAVFARRGLRAIYGLTLNDTNCPADVRQDPDRALDASRQLAARWHGAENGRLRYAFSPRTPIRCSEKLMRGAAALADMLQCHIQTHVAESLDEVADVRHAFPEYVDEVDVFADMGLLTPRTILAHGVFLHHPQQRRQLAEKRVALVHCPTANMFRESGLMDYVALCRAGIRIALGSSIAGGPEPFMPRVAVEGLHTAKALKVHSIPRRATEVPSPAEAWWVLTRGGAEALGIGDRVGLLDPGHEADCLIIRPERWIAELPPEQRISALLYTITPQQIEQVWIGGRRVSNS